MAKAPFSRSFTIIRNILYNFVFNFFTFFLNIIFIPFLILKMGNEAYGIFLFASSILGYFLILDMGFGSAMVKYLAEFRQKNDKESIRKIVGTSITLYLILGLLGTAAILLLSNFFVYKFLKLSPAYYDAAKFGFYIYGIFFFIVFLGNNFVSILYAIQRFDIYNIIGIITMGLYLPGIALILKLGYGLKEVFIYSTVITVLRSVIHIVITKFFLREASFCPGLDKILGFKFMKFGFSKFISQVAALYVFQCDRLFIGYYLNALSIPFYAVPSMMCLKISQISGSLLSPIYPVATELTAASSTGELRELYLRSTKILSLASACTFSLIIAFSKPVLLLWLGQEFAQKSTLVLQFLGFSFFLSSLLFVPIVFADSAGRPDFSAKINAASAIILTVLYFILIPSMGITGAAISFAGMHIIIIPAAIWYVNSKLLGIGLIDFMKGGFLKVLFTGALTGIAGTASSGFIKNSLTLGIAVFLCLILSCIIILGLRLFDATDKQIIKNFLSKKAETL